MKILFLFFSFSLLANVGVKTQVETCISASNGKLIVPNGSSFTVYQTCPNGQSCLEIPNGFSCMVYSVVPKSTSTACTIIPPSPPPDTTPTEPLPPVVPQCDSIQCPMGQTRTATDTAVTCSWSALELDPVKESAYNAQKAAAESTSAVYQESQLYNNLQDYCLYTSGLACPALPPATFNATASSFSYITGKPLAEVKKLMRKKIGKKK